MDAILVSLGGAVSQGILWAVMAMGVYLSFKVLNYADMTVDGSFALGGVVSAVLIERAGMNPLLSVFFAVAAGLLAGLITGLLHTVLEIPAILSGILTMIAMYSINIRIMGQPNTSLLGIETLFSQAEAVVPLSSSLIAALIGGIFAAVIIGLLYWFFGTEIGSAVRATGCNENMVRALGVSTNQMKVVGLMIANGLVALSGALVAQQQAYADVGMGVGTIVIGLASIIIGEVIFGTNRSFAVKLFSVVIGSIIYRVIIAVVLRIGLNSTDLKLITAIIVAFCLAVPVLMRKNREHAQMRKAVK